MKIISIALFVCLLGGLSVLAAPVPVAGQKSVVIIYGVRSFIITLDLFLLKFHQFYFKIGHDVHCQWRLP